MKDNSARFRPLAFVLGVSFIVLLFLPVDDDVDLLMLTWGMIVGAIFVAYGIGGPSLLKKIGLASFVTKKESTSKHKIKNGLSFLTMGVGLGIFLLFFEQGGWVVRKLHVWPFILSTIGLIALARGLFTRSQEGGAEADPETPTTAPEPDAEPETPENPTPPEDE